MRGFLCPRHSSFFNRLSLPVRLIAVSEEPPVTKPQKKESQSALAVEMILSDAKRPMTTFEVTRLFHEIGCPDSPSRLLNQLKQEGKIHGKLSIKKKTMLWWAPEVEEPFDD